MIENKTRQMIINPRLLLLFRFTILYINEQQFVALKMLISPIQIIVCGIPHGSKFDPVLFLLQIIDIPDSSNNTLFRIFG